MSVGTTAFDPYRLPLAGPHLVEASAGTGKTYAIGSLVLRLLLEEGPDGREPPTVDRVLVVTFTRAATYELRERLRARLRAAFDAVQSGSAGPVADDPAGTRWLQAVVAAEPDGANAVRRRLARALSDFDDAAIFTIHGFCQRMLAEFAFESRADFAATLVQDESALVEDAVYDYWAGLTYGAPAMAVAWLADEGRLSADAFLKVGQALAGGQDLERVPPRPAGHWDADRLAALAQRYDAAWRTAGEAWRRGGLEALQLVAQAAESQVLNGNQFKAAARERWPTQLAAAFETPPPWPDETARKLVGKLGALEKGCNKGRTPPCHPFLDACRQLDGELGAIRTELLPWALALRHDLGAWLAGELPRRKRQAHRQSFDDLLHQLHEALGGETRAAARLAGRVRGRFRAALIDEFQDTDRVQYEVFRAVFAPDPPEQALPGAGGQAHEDSAGAGRQPLLLVGDPKQAIYAFRGADVFAYLEAVRAVGPDRRHTLSVNYRADRSLLRAFDALWTPVPRPFLFGDIDYEVVGARHDDRLEPAVPPLELVYLPAEVADEVRADGKPARTEEARRAAARAVAGQIARLLAVPPRIRGQDGTLRPVRARDVAVLVRRNAEARLMQRALAAVGVPCVLWSDTSVLDQPEAGEMRRLLEAVLEPSNGRKVRSALVTAALGLDGADLDRLEEDQAAWDEWVETFREWQQVWRTSGLLPMVRGMLDQGDRAAALLALVDGERRVTNLVHLAELLHGVAFENGLGPEALLAWFEQVLADDQLRQRALGDTAQLRLESDESAVRLVTVHRSKGLQYGVVYCPFLWGAAGGGRHPPVLRYHDLDGDGRQRLDIGGQPTEEAERAAALERLSEDLRVAYVAMTRACHLCSVLWGPVNLAEGSALAYLLTSPRLAAVAPDGDGAEELAEWCQRVAAAAKADIEAAARARGQGPDPLWQRLVELAAGHPELVQATRLTSDDLRGPAGGPHREPADGTDNSTRAPGPRRLEHRPARQLSRSSFTALSRAERGAAPAEAAEGVDHDEVAAADEDEPPPAAAGPAERVPLADLPAGARLGSGLHALLEGLDFGRPERWAARAQALANRRLLPSEAVAPLVASLDDILCTPLGSGELAFRLADVGRADRTAEMPYVLGVAVDSRGWRLAPRTPAPGASSVRIGPRQLAEALGAHPGGALPRDYAVRLGALPAPPFAGWLCGALDLVFRRRSPEGEPRWYLLDWKSNRLGATWADYAPDRLAAAMAQHHYYLQAHLYAVALHRHLALCQPGYSYARHFGGYLYLFVRGMRPDVAGSGVLYDRPPEARIAALDGLLREGRGGA